VTQVHRRDAVNDLYDHGCDLVDASGALRGGADDPRAGRAAPAVVGCIESALRELAIATTALERAVSAVTADRDVRAHQRHGRMRQGLSNLEVALHDAADAAAAARSLTARALNESE
jgi:hypothetical protein